MAYRLSPNNTNAGKQVPLQSCDDAGENGAGGKLLNLMIRNNIYDTVVIVCRWYGGAHLGPKRFTHIVDIATEALSAMGKTIISENSHHKDHSSQSMESRHAYDLPTNTTDNSQEEWKTVQHRRRKNKAPPHIAHNHGKEWRGSERPPRFNQTQHNTHSSGRQVMSGSKWSTNYNTHVQAKTQSNSTEKHDYSAPYRPSNDIRNQLMVPSDAHPRVWQPTPVWGQPCSQYGSSSYPYTPMYPTISPDWTRMTPPPQMPISETWQQHVTNIPSQPVGIH
jgi:hypothetical protein